MFIQEALRVPPPPRNTGIARCYAKYIYLFKNICNNSDMKHHINKYFGFTLAEVLITLGIIGVVAALTLPALINNTNKKELETAFKKQYSILQQAITMIKAEDAIDFTYDNYGYNSGNTRFGTRLAQQFKSAQDCGNINNNVGCILKEDDGSFNAYKSYTGKTISAAYFDDGGFISPDGTLYMFEQGDQSKESGFIVSIDVNGFKKRPNKMGYDLFMFQITQDGKILPMGAEGTSFAWGIHSLCDENSTSNMNGFTCAYHAMTDNNYFKNLK